jgi:hypothetical protein
VFYTGWTLNHSPVISHAEPLIAAKFCPQLPAGQSVAVYGIEWCLWINDSIIMIVLVSSSCVKLSIVKNKVSSLSILQELSVVHSNIAQCHVDKHYVKQSMTEEMLGDIDIWLKANPKQYLCFLSQIVVFQKL